MTHVQEDPEHLTIPHQPGHEAQSQPQSTVATTTSCLQPTSPVGDATAAHSFRSVRGRYHSARTASNRSSVASTTRRSISTIHSHVSDFQNVRFDPDPAKDISLWGGIALLISNMTGPGLVTVPIIAQQAGWLPTIIVFSLIGLLSSLSSLFICEAMTEVPGNEYFQSNVEFSNLVLCFFGKRYHVLVQIIFFLAMQTTNIASIAVSAQLFDNLLIKLFHQTCGIRIAPHAGFVCVSEQLPSASPFSGVMLMSAGVLLALAMILPLAFLKLSENIWIQLASFILVLLVVLQWIVTFFMHGLDSKLVPVVGSDISQIFGTVLFNYAFITTVPSWANAKKPSVSIHKTIGYSVSVTTIIYILVAILGGMAFQIPADSTLIQAINSSPQVSVLSQITGYTFPIAALITSIPINIIVIRYNLIQSGVCNMFWSNMLSAVAPWLIAVPCMTGAGLTMVINWSSLFLLSTANFIIPFILYIYSKKHKERLRKLPIIELEQQARLSREVSRSSYSGFSRRPGSMAESLHQRYHWTHTDIHVSSTYGGGLSAPPSPGGRSIGHHQAGRSSEDQHHHFASSSETSVWTGGHRRVGTNQTGHGQWPSLETPTMSGPYFSYARDGELHERDGSTPSHPPSVPIRPSGTSTVILHDPVTEMAQRKATLPRRVSHKDRILSLLSERHKRVLVQQQQKERMEDENEKPVPPMILLSQSTTDLSLDVMNEKDGESENQQHQQHSRGMSNEGLGNMSNPSIYPGQLSRDTSISAPTTPVEGDFTDATTGKRINRKSSILSATLNKLYLGFTPSSPPTQKSHHNDTAQGENRGSVANEAMHNLDTRSRSIDLPNREAPSPTTHSFSIMAHSPISPIKSAMKKSPTHSPSPASMMGNDHDTTTPRPSLSLPVLADGDIYRRDANHSPYSMMDSSRLSPSGLSTTAAATVPSTPDSASTSPLSPQSPDRRVSFSNERSSSAPPPSTALSPPLALSAPAANLERKPTFSSETKKAVRAAIQGLTGGSPKPFSTSASAEGSQKLLRREDSDSRESMSSMLSSHSLDDEHDLGPELDVTQAGDRSGLRSSSSTGEWMVPRLPQLSVPKGIAAAVANQGRRDSLGRMAAAFSSQPGSFAIKTARPEVDQQPPPGSESFFSLALPSPKAPLNNSSLPSSTILPAETGVSTSEQNGLKVFTTLSPSSPPLLPIPSTGVADNGSIGLLEDTLDQPHGRGHIRSVSVSMVDSALHATRGTKHTSEGTNSVARKPSSSTQSLKDIDNFSASRSHPTLSVTATTPTMHLTPPSPLMHQEAPRFGPSSPSSPQQALEPSSPSTPPVAAALYHSHPFPVSPSTTTALGGGGSHRRQSSQQYYSRTHRTSPSRTIAPPFLGGNNYSIPVFSSHNRSPSSDYIPVGSGDGGHHQHRLEDDCISGRRRHGYHMREPSRSTLASASYGSGSSGHPLLPGRPSPSSPPPAIVPGHDTILPDGGTTSSTAAAITATTAGVASAVAGIGGSSGGGGDGGHHHGSRPSLHESQWTLPQHQQQVLADFDALWSLRAIPEWVPISSLKIAWSSLGVLCFGIGATIIYDFVQLGLGNNLIGS